VETLDEYAKDTNEAKIFDVKIEAVSLDSLLLVALSTFHSLPPLRGRESSLIATTGTARQTYRERQEKQTCMTSQIQKMRFKQNKQKAEWHVRRLPEREACD
jgi:hypothetical protein